MELSESDVSATLRRLGRKIGPDNAGRLLSILGRDRPFVTAYETDVGEVILGNIINKIDKKLLLWLQGNYTLEDKAEVKVYLDFINEVQSVINRYYKNKEKFTKNVV